MNFLAVFASRQRAPWAATAGWMRARPRGDFDRRRGWMPGEQRVPRDYGPSISLRLASMMLMMAARLLGLSLDILKIKSTIMSFCG